VILTNGRTKESSEPRSLFGTLAIRFCHALFIILSVTAEKLENLPYVQRTPRLKKLIHPLFNPINLLFGPLLSFCIGAVIYNLASNPQVTAWDWIRVFLINSCLLIIAFKRPPIYFRVLGALLVVPLLFRFVVAIPDYFATHYWWEPLPVIAWIGWFGLLLWRTGTVIDRLEASKLPRFVQIILFFALLISAWAGLIAPAFLFEAVTERFL
jgi:MFS family permease